MSCGQESCSCNHEEMMSEQINNSELTDLDTTTNIEEKRVSIYQKIKNYFMEFD